MRHLTEIRWVLTALLLSFAFALAGMLWHPELHLRALEKPARMAFSVTVLLAVLAVRPGRKALWWGLIAGAMAGAVFICYQRWSLGIERPGGLINAITFGDIQLCMGMMCLAGVLDFKGRQAVWPALGALAGLLGSVATGTRGGWIAILFAAVLFVKYGHFLRARAAKALAVAALALMVSTYFIDQTGARERLEQGVTEVKTYFDGGNAYTNVGVRLELWKGALMLAERHPWRISTTGEIEAELAEEVRAGRLQSFVLEAEHFHNDILQVLVYGGVPGLLVWLGTLIAPFLFFARILKTHESASPAVTAPALAGLLLVIGYFSFGLTEVIYWSIMSTMFYAQMLFLLMGLCLNARDEGDAA
ncbi:O-antigen ligase family protein [Pseudoduganella namucuonensis]|uniref:O-antigen ligase family protein n=1 Tax=Pseudoduganella namucuonensis TaxID=1035707 RepID=UPI0015A5E566|nr:O-antigen ligase family protein [Pseudoduganella namucuonensis]